MRKYNIIKFFLFINCLINNFLCERLSDNLLGGWSEKICNEETKDYSTVMGNVENYLVNDGYSLDSYDLIPIGFFKQIANGINYRMIIFVKKKSSLSAQIYDIQLHKNGNDIKILSSTNPDYSSMENTKRTLSQIKDAVAKYYSTTEFEISNVEIQYEYHNIEGLHDYAIFDVTANLKSKESSPSKRLLIVYRNDRTFVAEKELISS